MLMLRPQGASYVKLVASLAAALIVLSPCVSVAQSGGDGSIYSRFGIGELRSFGSSQAEAMGGDGFALGSPLRGNFSNPAGWGDQLLTRLGTGLRYESVAATNAANEKSEVGFGTLDHVFFSFPLLSRRLGMGMAFAPFSRVGYTARQNGVLASTDGVQDPADYSVEFTGGGGLQKIDVGLGAKVGSFLSIGATANFIFGIIDEVQRTSFSDPEFSQTTISYSTRLSGASATIGLIGHAGSLLREKDALQLGLTFSLPAKLDGRRVSTIGRSLDKDTLGTDIDVDVDLPLRVGAGLVYSPSTKFTVMLDARYEPWTNFNTNVAFPGVTSGSAQLQDRIRLAMGVELLPSGNDLLSSYASQIAYRFGVFTDKSYVQPMPGQTLRSTGASAGISFPTRIPGTRIDMNFQVGRRGTTDNGLIKETFYRFGINVNIGERWFQKTRLG
jgi:hypothetical protein